MASTRPARPRPDEAGEPAVRHRRHRGDRDGRRHARGLAVNAFSSISLDPPTVMVCVQRTSSTHDCLFRASHLAINILSTDQLDVVNRFASRPTTSSPGSTGSPARSAAR